jgi:hypothetical protein
VESALKAGDGPEGADTFALFDCVCGVCGVHLSQKRGSQQRRRNWARGTDFVQLITEGECRSTVGVKLSLQETVIAEHVGGEKHLSLNGVEEMHGIAVLGNFHRHTLLSAL